MKIKAQTQPNSPHLFYSVWCIRTTEEKEFLKLSPNVDHPIRRSVSVPPELKDTHVPLGTDTVLMKVSWDRKSHHNQAEIIPFCTCAFGIPVEHSLMTKGKKWLRSRECFILGQTQSLFWHVYLSGQGRG